MPRMHTTEELMHQRAVIEEQTLGRLAGGEVSITELHDDVIRQGFAPEAVCDGLFDVYKISKVVKGIGNTLSLPTEIAEP